MRSEPRRTPPPVAGLEVRPVAPPAPAARRSAFVFPTALETERASVTPVRLGLERGDRRTRTTGTVRRVRGGGGPLRAVGVVMLLAGLAAVGAYLGLAAAHRTDLLARMGLPVPEALAPAQAPTSGPIPTPGAPGAPVAGSQAPATAAPPAAVAGTSPSGAPGSTAAAPTAAATPGSAPAPGATTTSAAASATPSSAAAPGSTPAARPGLIPGAPIPGTAAGPRTTASSAPGAGAPTGSRGSAGPTPPGNVPGAAPGPGAARGTSPAGALATAAGSATVGKRAGSGADPTSSGKSPSESAAPPASKPAASEPDTAHQASREADREKLLGAFADLEAAKESTVVLESTPKLKVRMGGKILGTTPVTLKIPAQDGPVDLEFFDTGLGLSKPEQLTLKPGDNGTHKVEFAKGKLVLKLQDGVEVTVDGKAVGTAPLAPLSLWEGKHVVQLIQGDQKERRTLEITGDEPTELEFDFPEAE